MKQVSSEANDLYDALSKIVFLVAGLVLLFWFLAKIRVVLLFLFASIVFAIALNPIVRFLERRGLSRTVSALVTVLAVFLLFALLGLLVFPMLFSQLSALLTDLPNYLGEWADRIQGWIDALPGLGEALEPGQLMDGGALPSLPDVLGEVGRYFLGVAGLIALGVVLISLVTYTLIDPKPMLRSYLYLFPEESRDRAVRAFNKGAEGTIGWVKSNVIIGGIEGGAAFILLTMLGIPAALLWAVFSFAAELVPRIGPYFMIIFPTLFAFAIDPSKGIWVLIGYLVITEVTTRLIAPYVTSSQMQLHPVFLLFVVLAMALAFGIAGALIAMPLAGFLKAFYEEFYLAGRENEEDIEPRIEKMLDP